jgi:hypothetical protein
LVISPLDGVNQETATIDGGGGTGASSTGGTSGAAGAVACTTHVECSTKLYSEEPARCVEGVCRPIKTTHCPCVPNLPGEVWKEQDSILIGAFAGLETEGDRCEVLDNYNYQLALEEINADAVGGLPGPNSNPRKIALVVCDNQSIQMNAEGKSWDAALTDVRSATAHLTTTLKVPGVLSYLDAGHFIQVFGEYATATQTGTMFLSPNGTTEAFYNFADEKDLAWHMLGLLKDIAPGYGTVFPRVAQQALATLPLWDKDAGIIYPDAGGPTPELRVALIRSTDAFSAELTPAVRAVLSWQGNNWQQMLDAKIAREYVVDGSNVPAATKQDIIEFGPHVMISTGSGGSSLANQAEASGWRPYYILSPFDLADADGLLNWIEDANLNPEVEGYEDHFILINAAGSEDADLVKAYEGRLNDYMQAHFFTPKPGPTAENLYDATYFLVLAMYAADRTGTPNALHMGSDGMPAIIATEPDKNVGPDDFNSIISTLNTPGAYVRLNGIMGPPTFDQTGVRDGTAQIDCIWEKTPFNLAIRQHVGHVDDKTGKLRLAQEFFPTDAGAKALPCLTWLNLTPE